MSVSPPLVGLPRLLPPELIRVVHLEALAKYLDEAFNLSAPFSYGVHLRPEPTWDAIRTLTQINFLWRGEAVLAVAGLLGVERDYRGSWETSPWLLMRLMKRYISSAHDSSQDFKEYLLKNPGALDIWLSSIRRSPTLRTYFLAVCSIGRVKSHLHRENGVKSRLCERIRNVELALEKQGKALGVDGLATSALEVLDLAKRIEILYCAFIASLRVRDIIYACMKREVSLQASIITPDDPKPTARIPPSYIMTIQCALDTFSTDIWMNTEYYKRVLDARGGHIRDVFRGAIDGIRPCARFVTDEAEEVFHLRALWADIEKLTN